MGSAYKWRFGGDLGVRAVCSLDDVLSLCSRGSYDVLICDVEPLLVHWDASGDDLAEAVSVVRAAIWPTRLLLCTNSSRFAEISATLGVTAARKPMTELSRFGEIGSRRLVAGDLLLLDGLLALRLRADFLWLKGPSNRTPIWPRIQTAIDGLAKPVLLVSMEES